MSAASIVWAWKAASIIREVASKNPEFTTDDLWEAGLEAPEEPRALGSAMVKAAKNGAIVATDRMKASNRAVCRSRPVRVWRSLVAASVSP